MMKDFKVISDRELTMWKKLTGEEKWIIAGKFHATVSEELGKYIKDIHPDWEERQVSREIVRFWHGEELASLVFDGRGELGK